MFFLDLLADFSRTLPAVKYLTGREAFWVDETFKEGCSICRLVDVHQSHGNFHIGRFHPEELWVCPIGNCRHVFPVVAYNRAIMEAHMEEGHGEMKVEWDGDVPVPTYKHVDLSKEMQPLAVRRKQLTMPYILLGESTDMDLVSKL